MARDLNRKTRYDIQYNKENIRRVRLDLNKRTDADIISFFDSEVPNKQGYLKELIRKDMEERVAE